MRTCPWKNQAFPSIKIVMQISKVSKSKSTFKKNCINQMMFKIETLCFTKFHGSWRLNRCVFF